MENFEKHNTAEAATERDLRNYFESYVSDAESQEDEEVKAAYVDLDTMRSIISDIEKGEYASAQAYLESEIKRMDEIQVDAHEGDIEEGRPYVEQITKLRGYVVSLQS